MTARLTQQTEQRHAVLIQPLQIGPVTAPNRFYQVPHCTVAAPEDVAAMRQMTALGGWGVACVKKIEFAADADSFPCPAVWRRRPIWGIGTALWQDLTDLRAISGGSGPAGGSPISPPSRRCR